jgi:hypothetical protein
LRRSSSFSASKYSVVTSYSTKDTSPAVAAWVKQAAAIWSRYPRCPHRFNVAVNVLRCAAVQSQFGQHPHRIGLTGRLHQAREHQLEERLVPDNVEPELSPSSLNHLDQDPRALPDHDRLTRTALSQAQIQLALALMHLLAAGLHQHRQLSLRMRRPKMLDHLVPPANTLSDLHRRRSRRRPHLPQEHHEKARYPPG